MLNASKYKNPNQDTHLPGVAMNWPCLDFGTLGQSAHALHNIFRYGYKPAQHAGGSGVKHRRTDLYSCGSCQGGRTKALRRGFMRLVSLPAQHPC